MPLDFGSVNPFPAATPDAPIPAATNLERAAPLGFCLRTDAEDGGDEETWGIEAYRIVPFGLRPRIGIGGGGMNSAADLEDTDDDDRLEVEDINEDMPPEAL